MAHEPLISDAEFLAMGIAMASLGAVAESVRDTARATATGKAISYLQLRYKLPLTEWGNDIKGAVAHIASWEVLCIRGFNPQSGNDLVIKSRADEAVAWFKDVATGKAQPDGVVDSSSEVEEHGPLVSSDPVQWKPYGRRCE